MQNATEPMLELSSSLLKHCIVLCLQHWAELMFTTVWPKFLSGKFFTYPKNLVLPRDFVDFIFAHSWKMVLDGTQDGTQLVEMKTF